MEKKPKKRKKKHPELKDGRPEYLDMSALERECRIRELTMKQFFSLPIEEVGYSGGLWKLDVLIVNGTVVIDRHHHVSKRGRALLKRWFVERFNKKR